ncbi:MAG: hypothetical protein ACYC69_01595 [Thermodesulfovibrionales bacterium]
MASRVDYQGKYTDISSSGDVPAEGLCDNILVCPFVSRPFEKCYCTSTSSMVVEATIYFCGGNYKQCEIYGENVNNA